MIWTMIRATKENVAVRAGLIYGLIGGIICFIFTAESITRLSQVRLGLLGGLIGFTGLVLFVYFFLIYALAGRLAASRTGQVGDGAVAGLITGIVTSIFACIAVMGQSFLAPDTIVQIGPHIVPTPGNVLVAAACVLINALSTFASLSVCVGLGALGGCAGRKVYRQAQRSTSLGPGGAARAASDA